MPGVLIIDDDVELTALLKEYLEQEEFKVTVVHEGEKGIAEALSGRHAIAVLDVMMPGINGMDILRSIRARSSLPVLMLTARGEDTDCVVGLELGADDYVPKPCRLFWKFFFFIFMAQISVIFIVGGTVWLRDLEHRHIEQIDVSPPVAFYIESAAETLRYGGIAALRDLLAKDLYPKIYAVDESGRELLARRASAAMLAQARQILADTDNPRSKSVRQVTAPDGHAYLLFALNWRDEMGGPRPPPPPSPAERIFADGPPGERGMHYLIPLLPMGVSAIASLVFAALLAWHLSKPIRSLRDAFAAVSHGKLDVRPGLEMGARQDELADLGRGFDHMATQLQSLMAGQRRLLHDVSHELRSPLARMQVAIELAEKDPKKISACLSRIERESTLINYLIGELLTLSRLGSTETYSLEEDVVMSDLLSAIVDDARFEAQAAQREVELSGDCQVTVRGSVELLSRAIENVIRNAVKYTAVGSTVRVHATRDLQKNTLRLCVED